MFGRRKPKNSGTEAKLGAREFLEGREAYRNGAADCPYSPEDGLNWQRYYWWRGWCEGRFPTT